MAGSLPPPFGVPYVDPATGALTEPWRQYYLSLSDATATYAPLNAQYWLSTLDVELVNERNLGALASGYLKITVGAGVATPSTVTAIPASDVAGGTAAIDISGNAATATALQTPRTINGVAFNGTANVVVTAAAETLTGAALPALSGAALTALTGANLTGGGVYTPTLTAVANVAASTAYPCQYSRNGATVLVSGRVDVDPTAAATLTQLGISLPIPSVLVNDSEVAGTAHSPGGAQTAAILGDVANARAELRWVCSATDVSNRGYWFMFQYQVI